MKRALVIDDQRSLRAVLQTALEILNYTVDVAADGHAALTKLEQNTYTLLLCDVRMPGLDGIGFFYQVRERYPELAPRILFITGYASDPEIALFLETNNLPYLEKPFEIHELFEKIKATG